MVDGDLSFAQYNTLTINDMAAARTLGPLDKYRTRTMYIRILETSPTGAFAFVVNSKRYDSSLSCILKTPSLFIFHSISFLLSHFGSALLFFASLADTIHVFLLSRAHSEILEINENEWTCQSNLCRWLAPSRESRQISPYKANDEV